MNIIIVGAGKVGSTVAENLAEQEHDVTVIDIDPDAVDRVCASADVMGIVGNGIDYKTLDDAQIKAADILIALTGSDELNMLVCVMANERTSHVTDHELKTIARVTDPIIKKDQRTFIRDRLGITRIINPRFEVAKEMANYILNPSADEVDFFARDKVELLSARLPSTSNLCGKTIRDAFRKSESFLICAIEREGEVIIPNGNDVLQAGDRISFVTSNKDAGEFFKRAGIITNNIKSAMIAGGGDLSYYLAKRLEHFGCKTRIIEKKAERCEFLDENLSSKVSVINGDATDYLLLDEEDIAHCDAFVAATGIDEENIMLSLSVSKKYGVKTLSKVNKTDFADVIDDLPLDRVIYPKLVTSERIDSFVKSVSNANGSNVESIAKIVSGRAFAIEFNIREGSEVVGKPLKDLDIRDDVLLCCINRSNKFIIPSGNDSIVAGDEVIVVTKDKEMNDIRDILKS